MDRHAPKHRRNNRPSDSRPLGRRDGQNVKTDLYRFGGRETYRADSYRPDNRNEFSFRSSSTLQQPSRPPSTFPRHFPDRSGSRFNHSNGPKPNRQREQDRSDRYRSRPPHRRQWKPAPPTSSRPLLQGHREPTPEQLQGMSDGAVRFKAVEDLSDSDEASMLLESDEDNPNASSAHNTERPTKAMRKELELEGADNNSIPKWSNPDPYTSLPLPNELPIKRKDVVQLIRKAKAPLGNGQGMENQSEDFISFGFDNESENNLVGEELRTENSSIHKIVPPSLPSRATPSAHAHSNSVQIQPVNANAAPLRFELHKPPPKPPLDAREALQVQLSGDIDSILPPPPPPPPSSSFYNIYPKAAIDDSNGASPPLPPLPNTYLGYVPPLHNDFGTKRKRYGEDSDRRKPKKPEKLQVHPKWLPKRDAPDIMRTPWLTVDHSNTSDVAFRLHKEICDFYEYLKPREFENDIRQDLVMRLSKFVGQKYSGAEIRYFGSFAAGLYLPDGDMDLVMLSQDFIKNGSRVLGQSKKAIRKLGQQLKDVGIARDGSLAIIFGAKVPIVKFIDQRTGLKVDISFENDTGLIANTTYLKWKSQYPAMPVLVTLVKQFLAMRDLNEVHTGGIGGFSVTCLVVSCMQHMPQLQSGAMDPMQNLGEIFMNFLNLYGNQFNTTMTGIEMEPARYFPKQTHHKYNSKRPSSLCIIDPNNSDNDISGGSHNALTAFKTFSIAFESLNQEMKFLQTCNTAERKGSILGSLYAGNYETYEHRRNHLKRLSKRS